MMSVFVVTLSVQRWLCTQVLLPGSPSRRDFWRLIAISSALAAAASLWALAVTTRLPEARQFTILALCILPAHAQDLGRFVCFGRQRPALAAASDVTWLAVVIVAAVWSAVASEWSVVAVSWAWGLGALLGLMVLAPVFRGSTVNAASALHVAWAGLLVESFLVPLAGQVFVLGLAHQQGVSAVGTFKLAQVLLSINTLVVSGAVAYLVPRTALTEGAAVRRAALGTGATVAATGGAVTIALLVVPSSVFAVAQIETSTVLVWTVALLAGANVFAGITSMWMVRIRALAPARQWVSGRLVSAYLEPAVGLSLSPVLGPAAGGIGQLANQIGLLFGVVLRNEGAMHHAVGVRASLTGSTEERSPQAA
jgi:hypothetical protein